MRTEDTFMEAVAVLNEKRVADFAGTNDVVGISAICRVVDAKAKLGIAGALAGDTVVRMVGAVAKHNIFTGVTISRADDVFGTVNSVGFENVDAVVIALGGGEIYFFPDGEEIIEGTKLAFFEEPGTASFGVLLGDVFGRVDGGSPGFFASSSVVDEGGDFDVESEFFENILFGKSGFAAENAEKSLTNYVFGDLVLHGAPYKISKWLTVLSRLGDLFLATGGLIFHNGEKVGGSGGESGEI